MMPAQHADQPRRFGETDGELLFQGRDDELAPQAGEVLFETAEGMPEVITAEPQHVWNRVSTADLANLLEVHIFDPARAAEVNVLEVDGQDIAVAYSSNLDVLGMLLSREDGDQASKELLERTREVRHALHDYAAAQLGQMLDQLQHVADVGEPDHVERAIAYELRSLAALRSSANTALSHDLELVASRVQEELRQAQTLLHHPEGKLGSAAMGTFEHAVRTLEVGVAAIRSREGDGRENYMHVRATIQQLEVGVWGLLQDVAQLDEAEVVARWNAVEAQLDGLETWMGEHQFSYLSDALDLVIRESYRVGDVVRGSSTLDLGALQVTLETLDTELQYIDSALDLA